jgi:hypothetical protein
MVLETLILLTNQQSAAAVNPRTSYSVSRRESFKLHIYLFIYLYFKAHFSIRSKVYESIINVNIHCVG